MKPGYQTTEFWITLVAQVVGVLQVLGVVSSEHATTINQGMGQIIGGLVMVLPALAYIYSRTKAKVAKKSGGEIPLPGFLRHPGGGA